MKKRGSFMILLAAAAIILCACSSSKGKTPEFECEEAYKPTLEAFRAVIASPGSAENLYDGLNSVYEAAAELGDGAEDTLGYVFHDTNGDGREELFIGCFDAADSADVKNEIYAAFRHDGDSLTPLFEKQKRNTFALTDTGTFYFYGSDESNYYILGEYELGEDGSLACIDFYFTYPKGGAGDAFGYYHNTSGEWDPACSEELDLSPEAFEDLRKNLAARTVPLDDVKFSEVGT